MPGRFVLAYLAFAVADAFGQAISPVKAGDRAPDIDWSHIVRRPEAARYQPNLAGEYTMLQFLPNITANAQAIGRWNELVAKFADRPVQFVWIASEKWSAVEPFLQQHPISGWLLMDPKNEVAHTYGVTFEDVIVDPSGRIAGFTSFLEPDMLSAVLDGKAVAIPRETDDEQVMKLLADGKVRLESEPDTRGFEPPATPPKPDIPASYEVHISRSKSKGEEGSSGPDFWVQPGFDLKAMASLVYEKDLSRVVIPQELDNGDKFDFVLVLPKEEDEKTIHQLVQRAIEKQFKISAAVETKPADVYVLTAVKGKTPKAKTGPESLGGGSISSSSFEFAPPPGTPQTPEAIEKAMKELMKDPDKIGISNISAGNTTMDEFRRSLELSLGRPVIDETGLDGVYDLEVHGDAKNTDEFIRMLREQTGLVMTRTTRDIEFLTLRSLN